MCGEASGLEEAAPAWVSCLTWSAITSAARAVRAETDTHTHTPFPSFKYARTTYRPLISIPTAVATKWKNVSDTVQRNPSRISILFTTMINTEAAKLNSMQNAAVTFWLYMYAFSPLSAADAALDGEGSWLAGFVEWVPASRSQRV